MLLGKIYIIVDIVENRADGTFEKARLRFAHAETVVPFSCLLGLFLEGPGMFPPLRLVLFMKFFL